MARCPPGSSPGSARGKNLNGKCYSKLITYQVVDHVLKDPEASDIVLYNRAKGLLITGAIFKSTVPDESDEERRELERCEPQ